MSIRFRGKLWGALVGLALLAALGVATTRDRWLPVAREWLAATSHGTCDHDHGDDDHDHEAAAGTEHPANEHAEHGHAAEGPAEAAHDEHGDEGKDEHGDEKTAADGHQHDEAEALRLSKQAEANIGLRLAKVELRPFDRTISVPATVVQRPGRSQIQVAAPFTGQVTKVYRGEGEAVVAGMPLFDLRLTHEELVEAQGEFLRTVQELDVVRREVARLSKLADQGAIAGKSLLERQYEQQKLEAALHAMRQRLLLHRLTPEQVDRIQETRTLLDAMTVATPQPGEGGQPASRPLQIQKLSVDQGQNVAAGQTLCVLADHADLYLQGKAFEQDIPALSSAAARDAAVEAVFQGDGQQTVTVGGLKILALGNEVEMESRAFSFYVALRNEILRDTGPGAAVRHVDWKFKPGQRARLVVPVQRWTDRIVLPVEAVVQEGAEAYVFERNEEHFDRRRVHVEYRDQDSVVIANDGSLKPGVTVAVAGSYQIHLATKSKSGQGVDPHAGHNH